MHNYLLAIYYDKVDQYLMTHII